MQVMGHTTSEVGRAFQILGDIGTSLFKLERWKDSVEKASRALLLLKECVKDEKVGTREVKDGCYNTFILLRHLHAKHPPDQIADSYGPTVPTTQETNAEESEIQDQMYMADIPTYNGMPLYMKAEGKDGWKALGGGQEEQKRIGEAGESENTAV